jgi:hypothetical protein
MHGFGLSTLFASLFGVRLWSGPVEPLPVLLFLGLEKRKTDISCGRAGGSGNALADLKFRVCALVARAMMKQLKLAAMGKLRPDVQELGTQLCSCLSAFMQRECYRYQHHADIIFSEGAQLPVPHGVD